MYLTVVIHMNNFFLGELSLSLLLYHLARPTRLRVARYFCMLVMYVISVRDQIPYLSLQVPRPRNNHDPFSMSYASCPSPPSKFHIPFRLPFLTPNSDPHSFFHSISNPSRPHSPTLETPISPSPSQHPASSSSPKSANTTH